MAMKLGASGAGTMLCASSTPLLVFTNRMSPQLVTEQLHMLCCDVPYGGSIMLSTHTTSASPLSAVERQTNGPALLFRAARRPRRHKSPRHPGTALRRDW